MHVPDDFGLSVVQTLAHAPERTLAPTHSAFWTAWQQAVFAGNKPALVERREQHADPSDPTASHEFESFRGVRIGASLFPPPKGTPVRAGLVALHGYGPVAPLGSEGERWEKLRAFGVAVLCLRVRGFPGSMADVPQFARWPLGWITFGLDAPMSCPSDLAQAGLAWSLPQAIADVVNGCRSLARTIGGEVPIFMHGESFGGGLAVLAAAQLEDHLPPARLVIALPSLADWPWRSTHPDGGSAAEVSRFLKLNPPRHEHICQLLRLADPVVHAPRVRATTLAKLAERDDVVPAPTAAGVYNSLGTDPGHKWRFVVPFGHFDGGIRNARRVLLFERVVHSFLDPSQSPDLSMREWEGLMWYGERRSVGLA